MKFENQAKELMELAAALRAKGRFQFASQAGKLAQRCLGQAARGKVSDWDKERFALADDLRDFWPKAQKAMLEAPKRLRMAPDQERIRKAARAREKRKLKRQPGLAGSKWEEMQTDRLIENIERQLSKSEKRKKKTSIHLRKGAANRESKNA